MNDLAPITQMFNSVDADKQNEIVDHIYSKITSLQPLHDIVENINRKNIRVCPCCGKTHYYLNGKRNGVQTYKCKKSGKRFNEFTGTSVAYLKKKDLLRPFIQEMLSGSSLKTCTKLISISIQTAFDWRHKILAAVSKDAPRYFSGIAEMFEHQFSFSTKGQGAKARKIGQKGEINEDDSDTEKKKKNRDPVSVVVVNDRNNNLEFKVIKQGEISNADLKKEFSSKLKNIKKLCIEEDIVIKQFAINKKISYHINKSEKRVKGKNKYFNTITSRRTLFNLLFWMERFKGVSSTYLQNYLYWFMLIEQLKHERDLITSFLEHSIQVKDGKERYKSCRMFD